MDVERLQKALEYQFNDIGNLRLALTHRSVGASNNERLEFLGDAILGFEVADILFREYPEASEGQLSRSRARLVKRESLAAVARRLNLGEYLILGPGELRSGGQNRDSILSDTVEAILAAVYIDGGMAEARSLVGRLLGEVIHSSSPLDQPKDHKTRLQEYLQAGGNTLPEYETLSIEGNQHEQTFVVRCHVPSLHRSAIGKGKSRRKSEQRAAGELLATRGEK